MMDGWMSCDFASFATVFQSYQDDGWVIMKGCVQRLKIFPPPAGLEPKTAKSVGSNISRRKRMKTMI